MRYSRLEAFANVGRKGVQRLRASIVAVVGVGALGSVAAEMLVRAGVGKVILIDRDIVELSNVQRQALYTEEDVHKVKAIVAKERLVRMNGEVQIDAHAVDLDVENVHLLAGVDLVVDGTDNFYTRFVMNEYCAQEKIPWVFAAVVGAKGMVFPVLPGGPCVRCVFQEPQGMLGTCDTEGVIAPAVYAVAGVQGAEVMRVLVGKRASVQLLKMDVWDGRMEKLQVEKRPECPVCNGTFEFLSGVKRQSIVKVCGADTFQFKPEARDVNVLAERLQRLGTVVRTEQCLFFDRLIIFKDGRVLVKADSLEQAKAVYAKYIG